MEEVRIKVPHGWKVTWDTGAQEVSFINRATGATQTQRPTEAGPYDNALVENLWLPESWAAYWSEDYGRFFFHHGRLDESTWILPEDNLLDWFGHWDSRYQRKYFHHVKLNVSTWIVPSDNI